MKFIEMAPGKREWLSISGTWVNHYGHNIWTEVESVLSNIYNEVDYGSKQCEGKYISKFYWHSVIETYE